MSLLIAIMDSHNSFDNMFDLESSSNIVLVDSNYAIKLEQYTLQYVALKYNEDIT